MPVTLNDEQVEFLKRRLADAERDKSIAEGASKIWNSPEWGSEAKALWKKAFPEGQIPEYDTEQRVMARIEKLETERLEREKKAQETALDSDIAKKRRAAQERHGFSDDEMKSLEEMMTQRNVGDYDVAAHYLASQRPAPSDGTDAGYDRQFWGHQRQAGYDEVAKDPEAYARREILKTFRDMAARGNH